MILPDINLLLYAYNPHVGEHSRALTWWQECLDSDEVIVLPNEIIFGFIRIATNKKFGNLSLRDAKVIVDDWLSMPQVHYILPDEDHYDRVMNLMTYSNSIGAILSDAVLASYAISNRAIIYSNDDDFKRFEGLEWKNPLI